MPRSVTHVRRTPRSVEVWPSASSVFRHQNGQQDLAARPPRCHRSEARLSQCIEHLPSRSRSTRRLPFMVCMAQRLSPLSSCLPSLCGAFLFPALPWHPARNSIGSRPPQYYEGSDCCHRSHSNSSPRLSRHTFPSFRPQTLDAASTSLPVATAACRVISRLRPKPAGSSRSPSRIRFVILQTDSSPPVALHPASRRRSYLRLQGRGSP